MSAPADLAISLALESACSGFLRKFTEPTTTEPWDTWYLELRGVYLCCFKSEAKARGIGAHSPSIAIDLRHNQTARTLDDLLILSSRTRELCFRPVSDGTASSTTTTLDEWARCINCVIESKIEAGAADRPSSSDLETNLPDVYESAQTNTLLVENPLNSGSMVGSTGESTKILCMFTTPLRQRFRKD